MGKIPRAELVKRMNMLNKKRREMLMNKELVSDIEKHIGYLDIVLKNHTTTTEAIFRKCDAEELKDVLEKCRDVICEKEKEEIIAPIKNETEIVDVVKRLLDTSTDEFEDAFGYDIGLLEVFDKYPIAAIKAILDSPIKPFHRGDIVLYYGKPHMFVQTDPDENVAYLINSDGKIVIADLQTVGGCSMEKYKGIGSRKFWSMFLDIRQILSQIEENTSKGKT